VYGNNWQVCVCVCVRAHAHMYCDLWCVKKNMNILITFLNWRVTLTFPWIVTMDWPSHYCWPYSTCNMTWLSMYHYRCDFRNIISQTNHDVLKLAGYILPSDIYMMDFKSVVCVFTHFIWLVTSYSPVTHLVLQFQYKLLSSLYANHNVATSRTILLE